MILLLYIFIIVEFKKRSAKYRQICMGKLLIVLIFMCFMGIVVTCKKFKRLFRFFYASAKIFFASLFLMYLTLLPIYGRIRPLN
ncbi:hypothetical protein NS381_17620 [Pantoea stewartii]|uniref:Inner membrane protein n=1 Tax=Pantoea stewartii TaxID=66269 RepID=A0AB34VEA3_9GAMM|nr:hypothetical protein NS381_17620 [Pantoea stewartii]KTS73610.1 hypothetical protein RSA30_10245 [Pantoea stewartii]KTS96590.1 hypothetical protein RSA13_13235 [Pantoea stewartii]KTT06272.1 hypothetical protein RSA36_17060 [Pantoea stewartii]